MGLTRRVMRLGATEVIALLPSDPDSAAGASGVIFARHSAMRHYCDLELCHIRED
jgi:hypothetical protein